MPKTGEQKERVSDMRDMRMLNMKRELDRRSFLKGGALVAGAAAFASVTGCTPRETSGDDTAGGSNGSEAPVASDKWYGAPQDPSMFEGAREVDVELLIIGYGAGGIIAATFAAQQGLKVNVIEKAASSSSLKGDFSIVRASIDAAYGVEVDPLLMMNEHTRYANGFCDPRVTRVWAFESGAAFDWLAETVAEFGATPYWDTDVDHGWHGVWPVYPSDHGFHYQYTEEELAEAQAAVEAGGGDPAAAMGVLPDVTVYLKKKAEEWGVVVDYNTPMLQLAQDSSGKITGAYAQDGDGSYVKYNASAAVILATGGYESDPELLTLLNPEGTAIAGYNMAWPSNTGDGIKAGIWVGGAKDAIPTFQTFGRAPVAPDGKFGYPYEGATSWMGDQPFLKVNMDGERVCCETGPYDYPLHIAAQMPENKLATIWGANHNDQISIFHTIGCSRIVPSASVDPQGASTEEGMGFEANDGMIEAAVEAGVLQRADTIEELAEKMLMPPAALKATVDRYNELAAKGVDEDFGKPAKDLQPLDTPPYTAGYFGGHILCTMDGLKISPDMQVLNGETKRPIEGLYAVGNCSGSMFAASYPELFIGNTMGRTLAHAIHAVRHILGS
jgi:succinate dehydrogenase/fumarate reductase flavoprotein subunit